MLAFGAAGFLAQCLRWLPLLVTINSIAICAIFPWARRLFLYKKPFFFSETVLLPMK
jgi:hypothetical protein